MNRGRRWLMASGLVAVLAGTAGSWVARANRIPRVAVFLHGVLPGEGFNSLSWHRRRLIEAFAKGGIRDGRDMSLQIVALEKGTDALAEARARDVVDSRPDVIFAMGTDVARIFQRLTRDIPVVFAFSPDPLREGLVQSYRHPGGNLTGTSSRWYELLGKRIELVKEIRPSARRVALLMGSGAVARLAREQLASDAQRLGLALVDVTMDSNEIAEVASAKFVARSDVADALHRTKADAFFLIEFYGLAPDLEWIQRNAGIPGFFSHPGAALGGGLVSLGISGKDHLRRACAIVARVLRGEAPAVIPVDQESSFELVLNLAAARSLGIEVPVSVRLRANRVIE